MPVEKQVIVVFAGTGGFLDEIPAEQVLRFENEFLEHMDLKHPDLLQTIVEEKDLSDAVMEKLKGILREFTDSFKVTVNA